MGWMNNPSYLMMRLYSYSGGGPTPKFTLYHIWKAYDVILRRGPIGRKALSQQLGIGEGSTRTILDKMTREGCVKNTHQGAVLTEEGKANFNNSGISVAKADFGDLTVGRYDCAVHLKGMGHLVEIGSHQRDEAVRAGASGATTLVCRDNRIVFPDDSGYPDSGVNQRLRDLFDIENNDVIIIGSASTYEAAEKGAVTAALSMGNYSSECWMEGCSLLAADTNADELKCLALAIHELVGRLPVTMRSREHRGVQCEGGTIIDTNYTGPVLEEALEKGVIVRRVAPSGAYAGVPIVAVPIIRKQAAVAVIGVVDITKGAVFEIMHRIRGEPRRGRDRSALRREDLETST